MMFKENTVSYILQINCMQYLEKKKYFRVLQVLQHVINVNDKMEVSLHLLLWNVLMRL